MGRSAARRERQHPDSHRIEGHSTVSDPAPVLSAQNLLLTSSHRTSLPLPLPFSFSFSHCFLCFAFFFLFGEPPDLPFSLSFLPASTFYCLLHFLSFCSLLLLHSPSLCSQTCLPVPYLLLQYFFLLSTWERA